MPKHPAAQQFHFQHSRFSDSFTEGGPARLSAALVVRSDPACSSPALTWPMSLYVDFSAIENAFPANQHLEHLCAATVHIKTGIRIRSLLDLVGSCEISMSSCLLTVRLRFKVIYITQRLGRGGPQAGGSQSLVLTRRGMLNRAHHPHFTDFEGSCWQVCLDSSQKGARYSASATTSKNMANTSES